MTDRIADRGLVNDPVYITDLSAVHPADAVGPVPAFHRWRAMSYTAGEAQRPSAAGGSRDGRARRDAGLERQRLARGLAGCDAAAGLRERAAMRDGAAERRRDADDADGAAGASRDRARPADRGAVLAHGGLDRPATGAGTAAVADGAGGRGRRVAFGDRAHCLCQVDASVRRGSGRGAGRTRAHRHPPAVRPPGTRTDRTTCGG